MRNGADRASTPSDSAERHTNLKRLFAPRSVAIVGASSSPDKVGYQAIHALKGFPGEIILVNPRAEAILGYKPYPSLTAVGKPIDLVVFAVPATACVEAVSEAIRCGCGGGLIISGGFAESGPEGAAIQEKLKTLCQGSSFRLLGPNTAGFVNTHASLTASFASGTEHLRKGDIAVVAQSSGINFLVSYLVGNLGSGVSCAIGVGNAIDIDATDALEFLAQDPGTRAIAVHLEGIPQGRRLYDALRRVTPHKPVVVLIVGREDIGEFAKSHTGNLVGSYDLKRTALRQGGAVTVSSTEELAAAAVLLSLHRLPPKRHPGFGVLTGQGGAGIIMLDWLKSADVCVPTLREGTVARIGALLPPMTYIKNPVDTARPGATFPDVLSAIADDDRIDAVIVFALPERGGAVQPEEFLPRIRRATPKTIVFGTGGSEAGICATVEALRARRMFVAESPEQLARAAIVLSEDAVAQWKVAQPPSAVPFKGLAEASGSVDEHAAKQLLEAIGIATPKRVACANRAEAVAAFRSLDKPVVAKILSSEIGHKTEAGGVHLNITDEAGLNRALDALDAIPLRGARRYLVEVMAPGGLELIVGAVRDASFGPTIMVGVGGTIAEAIKDTATRVAPISLAEAHEMLDGLRASALLDGWRGSPRADRDAIARTIVSLAAVLDLQPEIKEIEINPLRVYANGVLALDALIA
jgi:acetyltransferase